MAFEPRIVFSAAIRFLAIDDLTETTQESRVIKHEMEFVELTQWMGGRKERE